MSGELTGVLREPWYAPRAKRIFGNDSRAPKLIQEDTARAVQDVTCHGITTVHDNTWRSSYMKAIADTYEASGLTVRVSCWTRGAFRREERIMDRMSRVDGWYGIGPRKYLLDGAFSAHSALLTEPYADMPDSKGAGDSFTEVVGYVRRANRDGRQLACHSIGDASTEPSTR